MARRCDEIWQAFVGRTRQAPTGVGQLRVAAQAHAVLTAIARLPHAHLAAVSDNPDRSFWSRMNGVQIAEKVAADKAAAMASDPALAWWAGEEAAHAAAFSALQERQRAEQQREWEAARPGVFLAALRKRGVDVTLEGKKLTVSAAAVLTDAERAEAAACKAGIVDILTAEAAAAAEAARRVVLA